MKGPDFDPLGSLTVPSDGVPDMPANERPRGLPMRAQTIVMPVGASRGDRRQRRSAIAMAALCVLLGLALSAARADAYRYVPDPTFGAG